MKHRMMERQRDFMFYIKYQRTAFPVDDDGGDMIVEVLPQEIRRGDGIRISLSDYYIRVNNDFDGKAILGIENRQYGPIKYHEVNVDIECGYVTGSVVKIFTNEHEKGMLNILHVHIEDMSDEVTLEVLYMGDGEKVSLYEEFKADVTGRTLRYKILVRDQHIFKVLYNQGKGSVVELPFNEVRIAQGDILMLENNSKN